MDRALASVLFLDFAVWLWLVGTTLYFWWPLTEIYGGAALAYFLLGLLIHVASGVIVIILLVTSSSHIAWVLPAYVGVVVLERLWVPAPNTEAYEALVRATEAAIAAGRTSGNDQVLLVSVLVYPFWPVYLLYAIAVAYVLLLRRWVVP